MKVLAFALLALVVAVSANGNGQPGCKTQEEMDVVNWRNHWDPTAFWVCETMNVAARAERCENVMGRPMGFMTGLGCVEWSEWYWVQPVNPPSSP